MTREEAAKEIINKIVKRRMILFNELLEGFIESLVLEILTLKDKEQQC